VPCHRSPSPSQLRLSFKADRDEPPKVLPSVALLEALADLLLAAMGTMAATADSKEASDERQDQR
jgi:hypothetical protein